MCKRIEELVADQFRNFTGVVVKDENQLLNLEVFPQKREPFKQLLRNVLPTPSPWPTDWNPATSSTRT